MFDLRSIWGFFGWLPFLALNFFTFLIVWQPQTSAWDLGLGAKNIESGQEKSETWHFFPATGKSCFAFENSATIGSECWFLSSIISITYSKKKSNRRQSATKTACGQFLSVVPFFPSPSFHAFFRPRIWALRNHEVRRNENEDSLSLSLSLSLSHLFVSQAGRQRRTNV